jgi:hypothetical protein
MGRFREPRIRGEADGCQCEAGRRRCSKARLPQPRSWPMGWVDPGPSSVQFPGQIRCRPASRASAPAWSHRRRRGWSTAGFSGDPTPVPPANGGCPAGPAAGPATAVRSDLLGCELRLPARTECARRGASRAKFTCRSAAREAAGHCRRYWGIRSAPISRRCVRAMIRSPDEAKRNPGSNKKNPGFRKGSIRATMTES